MYKIFKPMPFKGRCTLFLLFITEVIGYTAMLYFPFASQYLLDVLIADMLLKPVLIWTFISILIAIIVYLFQFYFTEYLEDKCCTTLANQIRNKLMGKVLSMNVYSFEKMDKGTLINTVITDTNMAAVAYFNNWVEVSASIVEIIFYISIISFINIKVTLATILIIPLFAFLSQLNNGKFKASIEEERKKIDELVNCYNIITKNKSEINNVGKEHFFGDMFYRKIDNWGKVRIKYNFFYTFLKILPQWLNQSTIIVMYAISAVMVIRNEMTIGELVMVSQIVTYLFREITRIIEVRVELKNANPLFERINRIMDFSIDVENEYVYGDSIEITDTDIYVEDRKLFHTDSFIINAPGIYILEAENGSGKSYFMKCMTGIASGIKSKSINHVPKPENIALFEKNDLFIAGSGIDNIFLGDEPDEQFLNTMKEILDLDFIQKQIDLRPLNLSLGEQQKILFCRYIWFNENKKYWILDEPLVNLDIDASRNLAKYIAGRSVDKNIIVISHDETFNAYAKEKYRIQEGILSSCQH